MLPSGPSHFRTAMPVVGSQRVIVFPYPPEASSLPSGEKAVQRNMLAPSPRRARHPSGKGEADGFVEGLILDGFASLDSESGD